MNFEWLTSRVSALILRGMFSGIVEATGEVLWANEVEQGRLIRIGVKRPLSFDDVRTGDSIASDGVCLTVESFDSESMVFALASETLAVTNWKTLKGPADLVGRKINLERSLKMGDRIHGHWVTGHVDAAVKVLSVEDSEPGADPTRILKIEIPENLRQMVWKKGSWAVNGVSLTVNAVEGGVAEHCLIPETLARTNLGEVRSGDLVNVEVDVFARALSQSVETYLADRMGAK